MEIFNFLNKFEKLSDQIEHHDSTMGCGLSNEQCWRKGIPQSKGYDLYPWTFSPQVTRRSSTKQDGPQLTGL